MKYIRTKDRIYEVKEFKIKPTLVSNDYVAVVENTTYGEEVSDIGIEKIISQADTIEELCDEFVFFDTNNKPHYKSVEGNMWYLGAGLFQDTLKGAIWTDIGLIYVAKMNNDGKLEI